ncbi:MAG: FlgD immunoglobulin-like domain containing protein, partial [Bacteroidota bacterium]
GTAPVASDDSYEAQVGETLTVDAPGLLGNDDLGDPDASLTELTVDGTPVAPGDPVDLAGGTLTVESDGSLTLENPAEATEASVTYRLENAVDASEATVAFTIEAAPPPEPIEATLPPVAVDVTGPPQQVTFTNTTGITLTDIEAALESTEHFEVLDVNPADEVALEEDITVTLAFAPQASGTQATQLDLTASGERIATFNVSAKAVDVSVEPATSLAANSAGEIDVRVSDNFAPAGDQRLEVRTGGARTYQSVSLTEAESGRWTGTVPADVVTLQGLDLYVVLSDAEGSVTVPEAPESNAADTPLHLQVGVPTVPAEGAFAAEQYQMISVPFALDGSTTADVLAETYGPYDTDEWRFFAWNPDQERYAEFPEADDIQRGASAWLITDDGTPFEVSEGQSFTADAPYEITLQPGWNQISTPFGFAVNWADVERPESVEAPVAYQAPGAERPPEYVYNQEQLAPWTGYFVFNDSNTPVSITVPPIAANTPENDAAPVARNSVDPDAAAYSMQITADLEAHAAQHTQTFLGFEERGNEVQTGTFAAAPPVGAYVRTTIVDDDTRYAGYYVDTPTDGYAWDIEVEAETAGAFRVDHRVRVRMRETGSLPDDFSRYVIDLDNERPIDVENQAFTAELKNGDTKRRYRIVVGTEAFAEQKSEGIPLESFETALHANYPNPLRNETTIEYELAEPGEATIEIYNVLGQRVRRLVNREHEAGPHTMRWDGRNDAGQRVASGTYFYRMKAGDVSTARQMTVIR